jgi:hypothetical protein
MSSTTAPVRLVAQYRGGQRERLWGEIVRPGVARVLGLSHYSDLAHGDLVKASELCSCGEEHPHYEIGERVFRAGRRVQMFTRGTTSKRINTVAAYLLTWPHGTSRVLDTPAGYAGYIGTDIDADGFPCGLAAYPTVDHEAAAIHWRISFPWATRRRDAAAFLEHAPGVVFHTLERNPK